MPVNEDKYKKMIDDNTLFDTDLSVQDINYIKNSINELKLVKPTVKPIEELMRYIIHY